jgi:hypothetical protein
MTQTVTTKEEKQEVLEFPTSPLNDEGGDSISFTIMGQTPERSYEDRSVYMNIKTNQGEGEVSSVPDTEMTFWLQGEQAIEFGMKLIEHGKFALEANMIQHQLIHHENCLKRWLSEDRVEEVQFEMIDDNPVNHGAGYKTFRITPFWNEGMAPEYNEDFSYEKVIYWSTLEESYHDQLDYYTQGVSYSFIGYDHDEAVRRFNRDVRLMADDFDD